MKKSIAVICLTVLLLSLCAWSEENPAGFSGSWVIDNTKSDLYPRPLMNLGAPGLSSGGPFGGMGGMGGGPPGGMGGGPPGGMGGPPSGMGGPPGGTGTGKGPQAPPQVPPMVIQQNGSDLQIASSMNINGKEVPMTLTYKCDGSEQVSSMPVPSQDPVKVITKATCKNGKIQIRTQTMYPNNPVEMKKSYSLSKDGKVLTVKSETSSVMTQTIQNQIYTRQ
jgi:hypothetical protein